MYYPTTRIAKLANNVELAESQQILTILRKKATASIAKWP